MIGTKALCNILIVATFALNDVTALARLPEKYNDLKTNSYKLVDECGAKYNIDRSTIYNAIDNDSVQNLHPCFLGCVFEKIGLINDKGYATPEVATERIKKYISDTDYQKVSAVLQQCSDKVNAESPKDICESGSLLTPCLVEAYDLDTKA